MAQDAHDAAALVQSQPAEYTADMRAAVRQANKLFKLVVDDSTYELKPRRWPTPSMPCLEDITPQQPEALSPFPFLNHLDLTHLPATSSAAGDMLDLLRWLAPSSTTSTSLGGGACLTSLAVPIYVTPTSNRAAILHHISGLRQITSLSLIGATTSRSVFAVPTLELTREDLQLLRRSLPRLHTLNLTNIQADFNELLDAASVKELSLTCCTCGGSGAAVPPAAQAHDHAPPDVDQAGPFQVSSNAITTTNTTTTTTTTTTSSASSTVHSSSSCSGSNSGRMGGSHRPKQHRAPAQQSIVPQAQLQLVSLKVGRCHLLPAIQRAIQQGAACLRHVQLQQCGLRSLPQELHGLTALVTLDLSHNALTELPVHIIDTWATSGRLQLLDLSDNQLMLLPEELCRVTSLLELLLHHNDLLLLPSEVGQLTCLRVLDVHANPRLRQLPRGLLLPPLQHQLRLVVDGDRVRSRSPSAPHQPGAGGWCSELVDRFAERLVTKSCAPQGVCC